MTKLGIAVSSPETMMQILHLSPLTVVSLICTAVKLLVRMGSVFLFMRMEIITLANSICMVVSLQEMSKVVFVYMRQAVSLPWMEAKSQAIRWVYKSARALSIYPVAL